MKKAPDAFRTISEVSDILDTPAHVLRFWESKFYQIKPVKRAGGRRYYRPDDVALINGIRTLLQDQGMTIRGVQRVLHEQGVKHVASLGGPLNLGVADAGDDAAEKDGAEAIAAAPSIRRAAPAAKDTIEDAELVEDPVAATDKPEDEAPPLDLAEPEAADTEPAEPVPAQGAAPALDAPAPTDADTAAAPSDPADEDSMTDSEDLAPPLPQMPEGAPDLPLAAARDTARDGTADAGDAPEPDLPADRIARLLRTMPRGQLGKRRDSVELLSRRIDTLLERMSEASGAGRW